MPVILKLLLRIPLMDRKNSKVILHIKLKMFTEVSLSLKYVDIIFNILTIHFVDFSQPTFINNKWGCLVGYTYIQSRYIRNR